MHTLIRSVLPFVFVSLTALARAQTGALDQVSPTPGGGGSAGFNGDATSLTWQAQVRAGLSGKLEGFTLQLTGVQGATLLVGLRVGAGWNTTPSVFQTTITKPTSGTDNVFVDATVANIQVAPGTLFVIEMQGQGTGTGINGSYVNPTIGPPLYPEPLFLDGPGCYVDCGWRIAFSTYVLPGVSAYCFGDGSGTACPCANNGAAGRGCANSINAAGAALTSSGSPSVGADTLVLHGSGMPNSSALYFQGITQISIVFGDGLRCVGGSIRRLGIKANSGGGSQYPSAGDPSISVRGAIPAGGGVRNYQCWYRNADPTFCTPSTFNLTNGYSVTWSP